MRCHVVRKHTSEFIDRFLGEAERERVLKHIASCAECREHLEATRRVISSLRSMPTPAPAADFFDRAILAIDREAEPAMTIVTRRHFRLKPRYSGTLLQILRQVLLTYEFNLISYGVALCISLVVFTWLLLSLRPVLSIAPFQAQSTEVVWVDSKQAEVLADSRIPDVYALPRISNGETVLHYPGEVASPDPDDLVVIAEVTTDGRGSIVQVLNGPPDQRAVGELASALGRPRTFVPARATTGMPIPSRVVLGFYRVDIWG